MTRRILDEPVPHGDRRLTTKEVAERLRCTEQGLANQRSQGRGPRYIKLPNSRVLYPESEIFAYEMGVAR
ncbi:MAG: helix-turn-helix domain-containing protein [Hyphomicrobiales bacterium]|nr:helix-turn-helix domain-containing protein [Hyphomicrobiales bacterium]